MASLEAPELTQLGVEHVERSVLDGVDEHTRQPPPHSRTARTASARPRPVSMPPVANADPSTGITGPEQASHGQEHRPQGHSSSRRGTSRTTVRVIGNYSLGKTLGAGSMGKVKLAYHNQTGEKVCSRRAHIKPSVLINFPPSLLSKLSRGLAGLILTLETHQRPSSLGKQQRMLQRRSGRSGRPLCL
jgi:serine/threonine protein kinase